MSHKNLTISLCVSLLAVSLSCRARPSGNAVCFKRACYSVEIASTPETRARGLQFRAVLDRDSGMLFVFPESRRHRFWMKDTLIPLDMIWLDYSQRVVHIERDVPPCESDPCVAYSPAAEAKYVLELNAGQAKLRGIGVGSRLEFHIAGQQ